ncbi:MAG: hypothetical protein U0359_38365 [Byssovorax sp.]
MNELHPPRERYASRASELAAAAEGDRGAARVLGAAGDLLRRSGALGVDRGAIDAALLALSGDAIEAWAASGPERSAEVAFTRAIEVAPLFSLAESDEEREHARALVLAALRARDDLESALVALGRRAALGVPASGPAERTLGERLDLLDRAARAKVRWLVGLNAHRRTERDLLDPEPRERAYWFSARAGCDGLIGALAGEAHDALFREHLQGCPFCTADLAASRAVDTPPAAHAAAHLSADDLFRYELDELTPRERARLERHADLCFECGQTLWALADGERAIEESEAPELGAS